MTRIGGRPGDVVDVLVIGAGLTGLTAAVSAAQAGARTLLLERRRDVGGTSALAIGSIAATGTAVQRDAGVADDADTRVA